MRWMLAAPLLAGVLGCTGPDFTGEAVKGPPFGLTASDTSGVVFQPVSAVLESRCGTLDCHGSTFRPLRIYGKDGLRLPVAKEDWNPSLGKYEDYYTGGPILTTPDELLQNYQSVVGLEPELMTKVVEKAVFPVALTLVRKPRLAEKHKGGKIWDPAKPGDLCLTNWLSAGPAINDAGMASDFNSQPCVDELTHK